MGRAEHAPANDAAARTKVLPPAARAADFGCGVRENILHMVGRDLAAERRWSRAWNQRAACLALIKPASLISGGSIYARPAQETPRCSERWNKLKAETPGLGGEPGRVRARCSYGGGVRLSAP